MGIYWRACVGFDALDVSACTNIDVSQNPKDDNHGYSQKEQPRIHSGDEAHDSKDNEQTLQESGKNKKEDTQT